MDRYYAILAKSITASGRADHNARKDAYLRVRAELDRLIASAKPKFPISEQIAHKSALEQAIARTEDEYAAREAGVSDPIAEAPYEAIIVRRRGMPTLAEIGQTAKGASQVIRSQFAELAADRRGAGQLGIGSLVADPWVNDKNADKPRSKPQSKPLGGQVRPVVSMIAVAVLAVAVAGWMLLSSLNAPSTPPLETVAQQLKTNGAATLFLGSGVERVAAVPRTSVQSTGDLFGRGAVRIASSVKNAKDVGKTNGARIVLTPEIRRLLVDRTLRVTIIARAATDNPSREMAIAISDGENRTTSWQIYRVDGSYRPYSVEYSFERTGSRRPIIAIWADTGGVGRAVEVNEVSLRISSQ